jgi:hypothetical protein
MNKLHISMLFVAIGSYYATHAAKLELHVNNTTAHEVNVEIYEKPSKQEVQLDSETITPFWKGSINKLAPNTSITFMRDIDPGNYEVSAYVSSRKNPLGKPYTFDVAENAKRKEVVSVNASITDAGVVKGNGTAAKTKKR